MQVDKDLNSRHVVGLQRHISTLQEDKKRLEACLDSLSNAQEVSCWMPSARNVLQVLYSALPSLLRGERQKVRQEPE
jgi:hypothetical protein